MKTQPTNPPKPFKTDGCSMFPDGDWGGCCIVHDAAYWRGGTYKERVAADHALRKCVAAHGGVLYSTLSWLMYMGVRAGGGSLLPAKHRWGYGWPYPQSGPSRKK